MCFQGKERNLPTLALTSWLACVQKWFGSTSANSWTSAAKVLTSTKVSIFKVDKVAHFSFYLYFQILFFFLYLFFMGTSEFLMHLFLICSQQRSRWTLLLKAAEVLTHLNFCKELLFCKIVQSVHSCGLQIRNAEGTEYTHTSGPLWTLPSADSDSREYTSSVRISTRCERALRKRGTAEE